MCFCCFYKRILAVLRRYDVLGKESRNKSAACFANGRGKHSFDTMLIFYELDAAAESIYICPQEILVGYPCKKREVIHIIHKVIRFWG